MDARFHDPLLESSAKYKGPVREIRDECKKSIYKEETKLQIEAAGYNMIMTLMDFYGEMIEQLIAKRDIDKLDKRNEGLYQLLPRETRDRLRPADA